MREAFLLRVCHTCKCRRAFGVWVSVDFSHKLLLLQVKQWRLERREKRGSQVFLGDLHLLLSLSNSLILYSQLLFGPTNVIPFSKPAPHSYNQG